MSRIPRMLSGGSSAPRSMVMWRLRRDFFDIARRSARSTKQELPRHPPLSLLYLRCLSYPSHPRNLPRCSLGVGGSAVELLSPNQSRHASAFSLKTTPCSPCDLRQISPSSELFRF